MTRFDSNDSPHRRQNLLTGEWVLVSPHRTERPWQGQVERAPQEHRPEYDPGCYLCPGNARAGGVRNPKYPHTYVFTNDFAALLPETPTVATTPPPMLRRQSVAGVCRVLCFSPRHDLTLPEMPIVDIRRVITTWQAQAAELGALYRWVQLFENKGAMMGSSNPHPHGQLWASDSLPNEPAKEDACQRAYFQRIGRPLLMDYIDEELRAGERIVVSNAHWVALVPFWAIWPFEILLLPRGRQILRLPDLTEVEQAALAEILKRLLTRYDNLFETSFPYSMGWHGTPTDDRDCSHWQLHAHFYPPLLRSATVRKFMVGYELLSEPQRDLTAEQSAGRLRATAAIHYRAPASPGASADSPQEDA